MTDADLRRALEVREGLRACSTPTTAANATKPALDQLEQAASRTELRAGFAGDCSPRLTPAAKGTDAGLARLLAIVARSAANGDVGPAQGMRRTGLPVGVLRQVEEPLGAMVLDGDVRESAQDSGLPEAREGLRGSNSYRKKPALSGWAVKMPG